MSQSYDKQHPAFYAVLAVLIFMSVGPVALMFVNSFKLDVDITSGTSGLLFLPTIQNYETALCDVLWYELDHLDFCNDCKAANVRIKINGVHCQISAIITDSRACCPSQSTPSNPHDFKNRLNVPTVG